MIFLWALLLTPAVWAQLEEREMDLQCPQHWIQFQRSCYRFIKSPLRNRNDARRNCLAYESELININNAEEHGFIIYQLLWQDPQHRRWYTGLRQASPGYWVNEDGTQLSDMDAAFLPEQESSYDKEFLVYSFSNQLKRWGFEKVKGDEMLLYICEAPANKLHYLVVDDRTHEYGLDIKNLEEIPRGPYFIKQPVDIVFDLTKRKITNDVYLRCSAGGYPAPTYEWFKEEYENDRLVAKKINPLKESRLTLSGGTLIINNPDQVADRGTYHCKATNKFGTIKSESVQLSFGFIGEFNLKRSQESGNQNWGKSVYCDPPQHYPAVNYYWARDTFPNFVEEDKRVFVSFDGALYFSALEHIDSGNYSCNVQSKVSDTGRNGPFFPLRVNPHSNFQQLKFPNNFPKAFPEAPVAGQEVRLECIAFGYPVPSYNWTRKGSHLPRGSYLTNFNRVLIIPKVQVEDQGEYVCYAFNEKLALQNSVILSIQAEPNFTIPLVDKHVDNKADLTWTCEAFGIPDVQYRWFRNGDPLIIDELPDEDRDRYFIQDNVLTIRYLSAERDTGMYQCQAQNQLKTRYSSAQLRVLSLKPTFRKRPVEAETYAGEGGNVTIKCNPEAAPRPKFTWKKDGNVIGSGGRRRIMENGNLIIAPVSRDDEGLYVCRAENEYGSDESWGRLIVLRSSTFIEQLAPRIVLPFRRNLELRCQAVSEEFLDISYTWTHNGADISDPDWFFPRLRAEGGILDIYNASFSEGGDYECIVKSPVGKIASKTSIIIEGPPGPPGGVLVLEVIKTSAVLQWTDSTSNGRPITHYAVVGRTNWNDTWYLVAENVAAKEIDRYTGRKEAMIENVLAPWSTYEFRVQAANEYGYGTLSTPSPQFNTPGDKPYRAPSNIVGAGGKIGDLTIAWTPLSRQHQNAPGIYYKVFWKRHVGEKEFQSLALKDHGNVGVAVIRIPSEFYYTEYDVKVQAVNEIGYGPESEVVTIYSAEDMPQVAPQQVSARSFNSTALNVTWEPIDLRRELIRGKLIGHRLKYWRQDRSEDQSTYYLSRTTRNWALIVGLQPDTYYFVKVMAYNGAGEGWESERFLERTYRKAPQKPPSSVAIHPVNPDTIKVTWRYVAPSIDEEPVMGYKVRVWEVDQDMSTANDTWIPIGNKLEAYISNLSPVKAYYLRVLAYSSGGDGRMSSPAITFQMGDQALFASRAARGADYSVLSLSFLFSLLLFGFIEV
nr:PREDICTED: contactin [Bemisia tabaci]